MTMVVIAFSAIYAVYAFNSFALLPSHPTTGMYPDASITAAAIR
ncbi:hypothetical protein [Bacillus haynesii]|nr:hypothetical protein [Bacillus haynesii]MEC1476074.1 hypothetical protein [Bacillus haynesii]